MWKILPAIVIVVLIIGAALYFIFFKNSNSTYGPREVPAVNLEGFNITPNASLEDRVSNLEKAVTILANQAIKNSKTGETFDSTQDVLDNSVESRLNALENQLNSLQSQNSNNSSTPTSNSTNSSASSANSPQIFYIPLGSSGSAGDRNYLTMPTYQVVINPANFPGYTSMQLVVNMSLVQSVGTANAQLYNLNSNTAISNSQVSTTSSNPVILTSNAFTLPSGNSTYALQLQSTEGYTINSGSAWVIVNY